jgi:RNA polymerase sigma factor (sigma-70 family)
MSEKAGTAVLRQLRFVVASWKADTRTDAVLLDRFVRTRDEGAFATLVGRHSELVWGVCLRVLRNPADAEDALQATFLRLARDAKRVANKEALAGWLFRAARDCAIDLRRSIGRQRRIEERAADVARRATDDSAAGDLLRVLIDDELDRLPRTERAVLGPVLPGRAHLRRGGARTRLLGRGRPPPVRAGPDAPPPPVRGPRGGDGRSRGRATRRALPAASAAPPALLARTVETGLAAAGTGVLPATRAGALAAAPATAGLARVGIALAGLAAAVVLTLAFTAPSDAPLPPRVEARPDARPQPDAPTTVVTGVVRGAGGEPVAGRPSSRSPGGRSGRASGGCATSPSRPRRPTPTGGSYSACPTASTRGSPTGR